MGSQTLRQRSALRARHHPRPDELVRLHEGQIYVLRPEQQDRLRTFEATTWLLKVVLVAVVAYPVGIALAFAVDFARRVLGA